MNIRELIDGVDELALKVYKGVKIVFLVTDDIDLAFAASRRLDDLKISYMKFGNSLFPEAGRTIREQRRLISAIVDNSKTDKALVIFTASPYILSDAFPSQIGILRGYYLTKDEEIAPIGIPTFGAEPSRILLHTIGDSDTIGALAERTLRDYMHQDWTGKRNELEQVLKVIGGGWPRAKLTQLLDALA